LLFPLLVSAQQSNSPGSIPKFSSDSEKEQWIKSHPEEYSRAGGTGVLSDTVDKSSIIPEFSTQAEKDAWVNQQKQPEKVPAETISKDVPNKETVISSEAEKDAYMKDRPNLVYVTQEEFNALPSDKQAVMLADPNYVITK